MKKIKLFFLAILFTALLHAQDNRGFHLSFNHMALSVKDVNRPAEFVKPTKIEVAPLNNRF